MEKKMVNSKQKLGEILVKDEIINDDQLSKALSIQKGTDTKLGSILMAQGWLNEDQLYRVLEEQYQIPYIDINTIYIDPKIPKLISEILARKHMAIPIRIDKNILTIAMVDPLDIIAKDDIRITTGLEIEVVISAQQDIARAINKFYDASEKAQRAMEDFKSQSGIDIEEEFEENADVTNSPMVRLVNTIISQAVRIKASDIHIEPLEKNVRIRYRVDGVLREVMSPTKSTHSALVTRIKIMGKMNISEKRIPQDGRVETLIDGMPIDMRISILPTVYGEKIVIRLLDRNSLMVHKEDLGFSDYNIEQLDKIMRVPEGIIFVTGPTGSGKTTTLYTILKELNVISKNIITVEDPVEYRLDGINQVQVNNKAGLTFANGLRSILRQDPDIIMVGEIRDVETAEIAVRASITGHVVLSTIHTNDTASTISRLSDMGIENYLIASSTVGIIAQRLVKRLCLKCKVASEATSDDLRMLGLPPDTELEINVPKGCNSCNHSGYSGRTAIHEILVIDREIRTMISTEKSIDEIKEKAREKGMTTLNESCRELVIAGTTSVEEMVRVTFSFDD